jgi:uncharacterized protein (TIGR03067 family)
MAIGYRPTIIVGIALVSLVAFLSAVRLVRAGKDPATPESATAAQNFPTLNADQYRQEITDIDRLIFEDSPLADERRASLAARLEALSAKLKLASNSRFIAIEAAELRVLAAYAHDYPASAPRTNLENQWMRIRNNVFDDRSWFARSAADIEPLPSASAAPDPFIPPGPSAQINETPHSVSLSPLPTNHDLQGQWMVRELYGNGMRMTDPEISDALWTFKGYQLVIQSPGGSSSRYTFEKVEDEKGTALRLESNGSNHGPSEQGWMSYEFGERELKLAFFDGLGARPDSFTPVDGKANPMLMLVILQRER